MVVAWDDPLSAHVVAGAGAEYSRSLAFHDEDPKNDVWRSVGLVAAALVNRVAASRPLPDTVPPPPPEARAPAAWLEGGALVGSGLEHGAVSFGGALRGGYALSVVPIFFGASGGYSAAGTGPDGLRANWTTLSLDAGARFTFGDVALRPRLSAVFARLVAEATAGPGAGTSGSRKLPGASAAAELAWPAAERFSLVLGAEGTFLSSGTQIRLGGERISAFPALEYHFFLGIQAALLR